MTVDPAKAAGNSEYQGKIYSFCSVACKAKFDAEPERYTMKPVAAAQETAAQGRQKRERFRT